MTTRRILLNLIILMTIMGSANAQDTNAVKKDTLWKTGGLSTLTFTQSHFNEWVAGGEDAISANARVSLFAKYSKNKLAWDNSLDLAYGKTKQGESIWKKNDDLIDLNTKIGYKASTYWFYSAIFQFKTQFTEGFNYEDSVKTSDFMSPGYINLGLGMDYKPNNELSVFMSPLNAKMTYVADTNFSTNYSLEAGEHFNINMGYLIKVNYQRELIKNINLLTKLDLFGNYENLSTVSVNWEVLLSMKVWKALAVNFNAHLIYDDDIVNDKGEPFWQFKEILGVGLTYNF